LELQERENRGKEKITHNLYSLTNTIRAIKSRTRRWAGMQHVWEIRNAYTILLGKPKRVRLLGKTGGKVTGYIQVTVDRSQWIVLVNTVMIFWVR
jgi:hypothetical protein